MKPRVQCSVDQCATIVLAKGLCPKHYQRMQAHGTTDRIRPINSTIRCEEGGCGRVVVGRGLCDSHYRSALRSERRAERQAQDDRVCVECGTSIAGRVVTAVFCSPACKQKARVADGRSAKTGRESYYRRQYGMSRVEIVEQFGTTCNICGASDGGGRHGNLHVDHDHVTGKVRGVLCHSCNVSLGHFRDDVALLRRAVEYLGG